MRGRGGGGLENGALGWDEVTGSCGRHSVPLFSTGVSPARPAEVYPHPRQKCYQHTRPPPTHHNTTHTHTHTHTHHPILASLTLLLLQACLLLPRRCPGRPCWAPCAARPLPWVRAACPRLPARDHSWTASASQPPRRTWWRTRTLGTGGRRAGRRCGGCRVGVLVVVADPHSRHRWRVGGHRWRVGGHRWRVGGRAGGGVGRVSGSEEGVVADPCVASFLMQSSRTGRRAGRV